MKRAALLVATLPWLVSGCPRQGSAPPPRLVEVRVVRMDGASGVGDAADRDALAKHVGERVAGAKWMEVALGQAARAGVDYRLGVEAQLEEAESSGELRGAPKRVLRAIVSARLTRLPSAGARPMPIEEPPIETRAMADKPIADAVRVDAAMARAHIERAVDDVIAAMTPEVRLHRGGSAELVAALKQSDGELRAEAIRVAALRKDPASVTALIELLKSDDAVARDRALGALLEIGDRRAVKPITQMARFNEVRELPKIIDAMGTLGGEEATSYLDFVISAHEDEEIRGLAREAKTRLEKRAATVK